MLCDMKELSMGDPEVITDNTPIFHKGCRPRLRGKGQGAMARLGGSPTREQLGEPQGFSVERDAGHQMDQDVFSTCQARKKKKTANTLVMV